MAKKQKTLFIDSVIIEKAKALINKRELKLNFSQFITDLILKEYNNEKSKGI